jgi:hypothetical protein
MSFLKIALPLTFAGLLAGLTISVLVTPRYVAIGVMALRGEFSEASVTFSNEDIAAIIEDRQEPLFENQRIRLPEKAIAIARNAIQISVDRPGKQSLSLIRVRATYSNRRGAVRLADGVVSALVNKLASGQRGQALQARVEELKVRLAALQAHAPVPPAPPPLSMEILDYPTVPMRPEFPNRLIFLLTGGLAGLLFAIPISRRTRYH